MRWLVIFFVCSAFAAPYETEVVEGKVSYISYTREEAGRPVTFVFNGGPGSSSVWLHLGMLGPRRVLTPEEGQKRVAPYELVDNQETLLDITDLVFIDPTGTGLSESDENNYTIDADIKAVGQAIRDYLTKHKRWNAPKYLIGESYGALRAVGLADFLQSEWGIQCNGIVLISSALDYQTLLFHEDNLLPYFLHFPSYVATAWHHGRYRSDAPLEEVVEQARKFVYETYVPSLMAPKRFIPNLAQMAEMCGLSREFVWRCQGKIRIEQFAEEFFANEKMALGLYDTRIKSAARSDASDPSIANIDGIFSGAFHEYLHKELGVQKNYALFTKEVFSKWKYEYSHWGYPSVLDALRRSLIVNPEMKVFMACGYFDLVTPFAAAEYWIDHLDVPGRIDIGYYEGGHMFYLNPKARVQFREDLGRFYGAQQ
jgi:carboxypeptidase C (cathepsin A)